MALALLLAICVMLFIETRIEAFAPRLRDFIAFRAEEALGGRVKFSIGNIAGGILNPISFNEIKLKDKKDAAVFTSIVIDSIRTNYHVWDLFFKRNDNSVISSILSRGSFVYVNFETKNKENSGFVRIDGDLNDARVTGFVNLFNKEKVEFDGRVTPRYFVLEIRPRSGALRVYGRISDSGYILMNIRADRIVFNGHKITCDALLNNKISYAPENPAAKTLEGEVRTRRLVIDDKPYPEVKAQYNASNSTVEIRNFEFGNNVKASGDIALREPYKVDLKIQIDNVNLSRILADFDAIDAAKNFSGTLSGRIELAGPLRNPKSITHLGVRDGSIMTLEFSNLTATLKGDGALLRIEDSRIVRESGSLVLAGEIDVRKIGRGNAFDGIKLVSDDQAITWDALNTSRRQGAEEVRMRKKLSSDFNFGFNKYVNDDKIDESSRDNDTLELEYKLGDSDSIAMSLQDGAGFLGLEHRDKF